MTLGEACRAANIDPDAAPVKLKAGGVDADAGSRMKDVAVKLGIAPREVVVFLAK